MKTLLSALATALILPAIGVAQVPAQSPTAAESVGGTPVIPRSALFGNPEKTQARVSDRRHVHFVHRAERRRAQRVGGSA
jgi:hypothetical protein